MFHFLPDIGLHIEGIVALIYLFTALFVAVLIVLENRTPHKTISWVMVVMFFPIAGIVLYLFFGQEYRKKKMFSRRGLKKLEQLRRVTRDQLEKLSEAHYMNDNVIYSKRHIMNLLLSNSNALISDDGEVKILNDGEQAFPAMFSAIEGARSHIHVEFYIISNDTIGNQFRELLIKKAREGVEVRLIYDDVGSWKLPRKYIRSLQDAGVRIDCFIKVRFPLLSSKVNYRDHRKIIVVDGKVAFVGGLNIADRYLHGSQKLGSWRDTHLMLTGGAASALQIVFMSDWYFVSREILKGNKYFRPLRRGGGKVVQIVASGPDSDWQSITQLYFSLISTATRYVYISSPYLVPNMEILCAMKVAALGGVDIRVMLPERSDAVVPKWATHSYIIELLEAGVKIYFYQPGFVHSKTMVVDGMVSSVGTANFDFRSLETNFEVNAVVYNEDIAREIEVRFLYDLKQSREITIREWEQRPRLTKIKESFARILGPML